MGVWEGKWSGEGTGGRKKGRTGKGGKEEGRAKEQGGWWMMKKMDGRADGQVNGYPA
jgi:hypothetical protein